MHVQRWHNGFCLFLPARLGWGRERDRDRDLVLKLKTVLSPPQVAKEFKLRDKEKERAGRL